MKDFKWTGFGLDLTFEEFSFVMTMDNFCVHRQVTYFSDLSNKIKSLTRRGRGLVWRDIRK